jgi:hypothetical protein
MGGGEIPRPAGENAGLRDDVTRSGAEDFKLPPSLHITLFGMTMRLHLGRCSYILDT